MLVGNSVSNICTLGEWLSEHNVNKDKEIPDFKKLFYNLDMGMKNLHEKGEYVTSFNINDILISGDFVKYNKTSDLYYEDSDYFIHKNIFYLSCLAIGVYNDCLNYINPENVEGVKENFSDFATFIPEDVLSYYKGIVERDASVYLSDYVNARVDREINTNKSLLESADQPLGNSNANKKSSSYSKSTLIGKLYTDDNNGAFIKFILFPVIIILLAILIPIMVILGI